jgi:hypothetical protein
MQISKIFFSVALSGYTFEEKEGRNYTDKGQLPTSSQIHKICLPVRMTINIVK